MPAGTIQPLERQNVASVAIAQIRQMIVRGELRPGAQLPPERDVAAMLGVSRPTLREAIRALTEMNVLESRHGSGTFVTDLSAERLAEPFLFVLKINDESIGHLMEARKILETTFIKLAAGRVTPEQVARLRELCTRFRDHIDDPIACAAMDAEFHDTAVRIIGNPIIDRLFASMTVLIHETRKKTNRNAEVRSRAATEHEAIVDALASGDPEAAAARMLEHLETAAANTRLLG